MNGSSKSHEDSPLPAELSGVLLKSVEEILHEPIAKEEMARALDRARQIAGSTSSDCAARPMRRKVRLLRRLLTAAAAAAAVVVVAVLLLSSERNSASAAWATGRRKQWGMRPSRCRIQSKRL